MVANAARPGGRTGCHIQGADAPWEEAKPLSKQSKTFCALILTHHYISREQIMSHRDSVLLQITLRDSAGNSFHYKYAVLLKKYIEENRSISANDPLFMWSFSQWVNSENKAKYPIRILTRSSKPIIASPQPTKFLPCIHVIPQRHACVMWKAKTEDEPAGR